MGAVAQGNGGGVYEFMRLALLKYPRAYVLWAGVGGAFRWELWRRAMVVGFRLVTPLPDRRFPNTPVGR